MKKVICLLLAAVMVVGLMAGCGGGGESVDENRNADGVFEVATVRWSDWGEAYHTGFPDQAAAELGITIDWTTILSADWGDRKAVMLAGDSLPDAFMGSICLSESDIMINEGAFIALDEYIDEYMPNFKAILESDPTMKALATAADGHIYGLPSKRPCRPTIANQMFINKTWLDNLGLGMPTTYTEFVDVLKEFKEKDANQNGNPNDEIPFGGGMADPVMFFCLPFGTTIGADGTYTMMVQDGEPVFIPTSEEYKAGIAWMHECYEAGLIDPEIFTQDTSMRDAKLMGAVSRVGVAAGWTPDSVFGPNADEYVALPALTGPDGKQYVSADPEHWNYTRYEFVVSADCQDPGKLLAWADKFYTEDASIQNFYGAFGVGVTKDEATGTYTVLEPTDGNSADTFAWINSLRDFGPKYVPDGFNDKVTYEGENGDAIKLKLDEEMKDLAKEAYPNVSFTKDQLNTLATLYSDIGAYVATNQATWVVEGGIEEGWDTYISTLERMGLSDFLTIMKDAYDAYYANN